MTTAEAALRQLLADVEGVSGGLGANSPLSGCPPRFLRYHLEKLARDGLEKPGKVSGTWRKPAPKSWKCTHGWPGETCHKRAVYGETKTEHGACEEHAVAMGAKAGT